MSQEIILAGKKEKVMRYFVSVPKKGYRSFDRAHEAWDHFRLLTGAANAPPEFLEPPIDVSINTADTSGKAPRQK
jgi:hypothetical protein